MGVRVSPVTPARDDNRNSAAVATGTARPALRASAEGGTAHGRRDHAPAARERRPLRAPDPSLEPEDEAIHHDRAQRHLHHRPAAVAGLHRPQLRLHQGAPSPPAATCSSSAPRSRLRRPSPSRPSASACPTSTSVGSAACSPTSRPCTSGSSGSRSSRRSTSTTWRAPAARRRSCSRCGARSDKLERTLGGIRDMARVPAAVWIVDTNKEHLAVDEARKLGIPIIAILDSNCDPDVVDYPIPGNDDAIRSVTLLTRVIADAVAEGLMARAGVKSGNEADRRGARRRGAAGRVGARAARRARPRPGRRGHRWRHRGGRPASEATAAAAEGTAAPPRLPPTEAAAAAEAAGRGAAPRLLPRSRPPTRPPRPLPSRTRRRPETPTRRRRRSAPRMSPRRAAVRPGRTACDHRFVPPAELRHRHEEMDRAWLSLPQM